MLKIAVVGTGNMGKHHARNYFEHKDVELVAICDMNKNVADTLAEKYNCKAYYDLDELLEKEKLDGVTIAVPTMLHKSVVEKVANKKVNILLEKPVAGNLEDAIAIKNLIEKNKIVCVVGHIERYNPAVRKALDMVFKGELGKIYYINAIRQGPYPPGVVDVDVLTDLGIHDLEIINYLLSNLSDSVKDVHLTAHNFINKDDYDIVRVVMKSKENIVINQLTDILSPTKKRQLLICGKKGLVELDYITQKVILYKNGVHKAGYEYEEILKGVSIGEEKEIAIDKKEPLFVEIDNFIKSIEGKEKPFVGINDAVDGIKLLEKIKEKF